MKLYKISQEANNNYDTYDSAVVAAENEEEARFTDPNDNKWNGKGWGADGKLQFSDWTKPDNVKVELIGEAIEGTKAGVICASFNAG